MERKWNDRRSIIKTMGMHVTTKPRAEQRFTRDEPALRELSQWMFENPERLGELRERIEEAGYEFEALFTVADLGI